MANVIDSNEIDGVRLVEPDVHVDVRGFFLETYHAEKYRAGGICQRALRDVPL